MMDHVCVKFDDPSCIVFLRNSMEKQTDRVREMYGLDA